MNRQKCVENAMQDTWENRTFVKRFLISEFFELATIAHYSNTHIASKASLDALKLVIDRIGGDE